MSNDDPFTLDLFNTTTLSSGLGLGVTAFGSDFGAGETGAAQASSPAAPEAQPAPDPSTLRSARPEPGRVVTISSSEPIAVLPEAGSSAPVTISKPSGSRRRSKPPICRPHARNRRG